METSLVTHFQHQGFAMMRDLVTPETVAGLKAALAGVSEGLGVRKRGESSFAIRNLSQLVPEVRALAFSDPLLGVVRNLLGPAAFPVRGILFDKTPDANWHVGWHQDVTIAVTEKAVLPGYERWSEKAGVPHVQPPDAVLAAMLTLRLHLDPCSETSGALRVIPGSHAHGRLSDAAIQQFRGAVPPVVCGAEPGDVLLMRPLLLHASSPAAAPEHRRVIHLEYAAHPLPAPLAWPQF